MPFHNTFFHVGATGALLISLAATLQAESWTHYAGDASRRGTAPRAAQDLNHHAWTVTAAADEEFLWRAAPVAHNGLVFATVRGFTEPDPNHVEDRVVAFDAFDGYRVWTRPIAKDVWDSWSSPAVDTRNNTVLVTTGWTLHAIDITSGNVIWTMPTARRIVNASPAVTTDLEADGVPANRALLTDYDGFGDGGTLYAVNVDPFDAIYNPYEPGNVVWTYELNGAAGNSPAYADGVVYVAASSGTVCAIDVAAGPPVVWEVSVDFTGYPPYSGFYGGLAVSNGALYLASYTYYGGQNTGGLFKLNATNGAVVWDTPCERTDAIPVVTDDGQIFIAGGLDDAGSVVTTQAYQDNGTTVTPLWDTYVDSGGTLGIGGWTHQPVYSNGYLYVGRPYEDPVQWLYFEPYTDLYVIDTAHTPDQPEFIVSQYTGCGASPAIADGTIYSLGKDGLVALEPSVVCLADLDGNGSVGLADLQLLLAAYGTTPGDSGFDSGADLDRNGVVDLADLQALLATYGGICE